MTYRQMWSHLINMRKHFSCYFLQFHILLSCHQIQHSYYPLPLLFPPAINPPLHLDWPHAPKKVDPFPPYIQTGPMPPKRLTLRGQPFWGHGFSVNVRGEGCTMMMMMMMMMEKKSDLQTCSAAGKTAIFWERAKSGHPKLIPNRLPGCACNYLIQATQPEF